MNQKNPKILFIGAVTFEEATGSHCMFYRLFSEYPAEKLMVIGSHKSRNNLFSSTRLPGVNYLIIEEDMELPEIPRRKDRLSSVYRRYYYEIKKIAEIFNPDLILTLAMNFYWYLAYRISKSLKVPLDLVLHDRWEPNTDKVLREYLIPKFKKVFNFARHRFCISPTMEKYYYDRLGIHGDVLYAIGSDTRPANIDSFNDKKLLTVVFFGNIWSNHPEIINLAHLLDRNNIELVLFSNRDLKFFQDCGLKTSNIKANPFLEREELLDWCQQNADILYVPMFFDDNHKDMVQCSFTSKIVDYTALGLPIIIQAPHFSSIVEFANLNIDRKFAEVITNDSTEEIAKAISNLRDAKYRKELGSNSLYVWHKFFAPDVVRNSFFEKISKNINIVDRDCSEIKQDAEDVSIHLKLAELHDRQEKERRLNIYLQRINELQGFNS